jgi:Uma2 family endonuclease
LRIRRSNSSSARGGDAPLTELRKPQARRSTSIGGLFCLPCGGTVHLQAVYNRSMSGVPKRLLTTAEYLAKERAADVKSEFFAGEMFAMAGTTRRHSLICSNLIATLRPLLRTHGCEVHGSDLRVKVSSTGLYTYPDAIIACGDIQLEDEHQDTLLNPRVIFEVLSKSTERRDRGWMFMQYRRLPSLLDYVLVTQDRPFFERFSRPPGGRFELDEADGLHTTMMLTAVAVALPLRDVYLDVSFGDENPLSIVEMDQ